LIDIISQLDEHNHEVKKNNYCPKKLALALNQNPRKRPKEVLNQMRVEEEEKINLLEDDVNPNLDDLNNDMPSQNEKTDKQLLQSLRNLKSAANSKGEILCVNDLKKFYQQNKLEEELQ